MDNKRKMENKMENKETVSNNIKRKGKSKARDFVRTKNQVFHNCYIFLFGWAFLKQKGYNNCEI